MVSLGGLSAVFPGYQSAEKTGAQTRLLDAQAQEYDLDRAGEAIWGSAFPYLRPGVGGVAGMGQRPIMQPGQPSVPMNSSPNAALHASVLQQESGNRSNIQPSYAGAVGPGQVMPGTWAQFAQPGENINDPNANRAVSARILDSYMQKYGDPARAAVAYFSGPGNVAPPGHPTPWLQDRSDGRVNTSQYVAQVTGRLGGQPGALADATQGRRLGIQDAIDAIERAAPNASPEMKMRALNKALPHIREEERGHIADMNAKYQEERTANMKREYELAQQKLEDLNKDRDEKNRLAAERAATAKEAEGRRGKQFAFSQYKYGQTREDKIEAARLKAENDKEMIMLRDKLRQEFKMPPNMDVEDLRSYAERLAGGEKFSPNFLGTGNQGNANKALFAHILRDTLVDKGMNPEDIRKKISEEIGRDSAQRAIGTMGVKIDSAATELDKLRGPAEKAIDALGDAEITRGPFKSWNMLLNMRDDQISDPRYIQLKLALKGVSAAYAQVLRRGAGMTVEAQRAADKYLDDRWGAGGLKAGLAQMKIEADQVRAATREAKENVLKEDAIIGNKPKAEPLKSLTQEIRDDVQDALSKGVPLDAIIKRLKENNIDTKELEGTLGKRSEVIDPNMIAGGHPVR